MSIKVLKIMIDMEWPDGLLKDESFGDPPVPSSSLSTFEYELGKMLEVGGAEHSYTVSILKQADGSCQVGEDAVFVLEED